MINGQIKMGKSAAGNLKAVEGGAKPGPVKVGDKT